MEAKLSHKSQEIILYPLPWGPLTYFRLYLAFQFCFSFSSSFTLNLLTLAAMNFFIIKNYWHCTWSFYMRMIEFATYLDISLVQTSTEKLDQTLQDKFY